MTRRPIVLVAAVAVLVLLVALPVLAVPPSSPPGQEKAKVEKSPITITGTVETSTDADGRTIYTLTDDGTTYTLHAGPPWFFTGGYPLEAYAGDVVTVEGEVAEGSTDVDVLAIDGQALREAGKPPWAGGWKRVGEVHPGWSQEKADRFAAKAERFGGCFPPGQCKAKPNDDAADSTE
jgi:hypothetical protein